MKNIKKVEFDNKFRNLPFIIDYENEITWVNKDYVRKNVFETFLSFLSNLPNQRV